jgi:hypothetical protein
VVGGYAGGPIITQFGQAGDLPITGDWDNQGKDGIGGDPQRA